MKLGVLVNYASEFHTAAAEVVDLERHGIDVVAVPEAYSFDAVSLLGYLAAVTRDVVLTSSIMQIYSRTPTLTAMTAAGLDYVSGGRFELGIGASGPQVVEGFHGVAYDAPLGRTEEIIEICRAVWRREKLTYSGKHYSIPLPEGKGTGLGKPLALINHPLRERIPISIASIGPKNVELTARVADGWQPIFFHPTRSREVWGEALQRGAEQRSPELAPLKVNVQLPVAIGDDTDAALAHTRAHFALYIGGMGARGQNFYHKLACQYGFQAAADRVQDLYLAGRKAEAAEAVPEQLVRDMSLIGKEKHIAAQLDALDAAGVSTLYLLPVDDSPNGRIGAVEAVRDILSARAKTKAHGY